MPSKHLCTITTNSFQKRYWRRQFSHCFPLQGWGKQNLKTAEFFQKEPNTKYSYVFSLPTLKINLPFPYERSPSACTRLAGAALHVRTLCYTLQSTEQLLPYEQCCKRTLQWTPPHTACMAIQIRWHIFLLWLLSFGIESISAISRWNNRNSTFHVYSYWSIHSHWFQIKTFTRILSIDI